MKQNIEKKCISIRIDFFFPILLRFSIRLKKFNPWTLRAQGPRTAAWLAGHRGLPGDVDPPPYRPVLILVDYSPLQGLTHRSEPDRDLYMALANSNFKNVSAGELEALFTWARQLEPIEAGILPIRDLRTAITTRLRTQWDIHLEPSNLEFRYCDLEGDAFQVPKRLDRHAAFGRIPT